MPHDVHKIRLQQRPIYNISFSFFSKKDRWQKRAKRKFKRHDEISTFSSLKGNGSSTLAYHSTLNIEMHFWRCHWQGNRFRVDTYILYWSSCEEIKCRSVLGAQSISNRCQDAKNYQVMLRHGNGILIQMPPELLQH